MLSADSTLLESAFDVLNTVYFEGCLPKVHCRTTGSSILPPLSPTGFDGIGVTGGDSSKKKTSTRTYVCTHCGISVRATKDVNLICGDCMDTMVKVD